MAGGRGGGGEEGRWGGGGWGEGYLHESWSRYMGNVLLCYRPAPADDVAFRRKLDRLVKEDAVQISQRLQPFIDQVDADRATLADAAELFGEDFVHML